MFCYTNSTADYPWSDRPRVTIPRRCVLACFTGGCNVLTFVWQYSTCRLFKVYLLRSSSYQAVTVISFLSLRYLFDFSSVFNYDEADQLFTFLHRSLNREGRWGTEDDFTTSFLHSSLSSTALLDLANSRHAIRWCRLPTSFYVCLVFFPLTLRLAVWFWPDLINGRHDHTTAVCVSLRWSGGLHRVRLPAGAWYGLPRW